MKITSDFWFICSDMVDRCNKITPPPQPPRGPGGIPPPPPGLGGIPPPPFGRAIVQALRSSVEVFIGIIRPKPKHKMRTIYWTKVPKFRATGEYLLTNGTNSIIMLDSYNVTCQVEYFSLLRWPVFLVDHNVTCPVEYFAPSQMSCCPSWPGN